MKLLPLLILSFTLPVIAADPTPGQISIQKRKASGPGFDLLNVTPQNSKVLGFDSSGNLSMVTAGSAAWSDITGKPTTLTGYGITDAQPLAANLTSIAGLDAQEFGLNMLLFGNDADARAGIGLGLSAEVQFGSLMLGALDVTGVAGIKLHNPDDFNAYTSLRSGSPIDSGETIIFTPLVAGTLIGSGDVGTVTDTMLDGGITNAKLANSAITINGTSVPLGGSVSGLQTTSGVLALAGFSSISGTLADARIASAAAWNAKENALTFSTGLTRTTNTITVNADAGLPSQTGNSGKYLTTNGTTSSWATVAGGVTSITGTTNNLIVTGATTPTLSTRFTSPQLITVSGPTAGRTWTVPDAAVTLATLETAQSFSQTQKVISGANELRLYYVGLEIYDNSVGITGNFKTNNLVGTGANLSLGATGLITFQSTNRVDSGAVDCTITRASAGVLQIGTTTNNALGSLSLAGLNIGKTITAAGTTGAQTINKSSGSVNLAAGATSLVVTNSLVTTSSVILLTIGSNDTTCKSAAFVAASGSFTIYPNAAPTAETKVFFRITN
jgi:hypothetical protein